MAKTKDVLTPHTIVLQSNAPIAICLTKQIAEGYAKAAYLPGTYRIEPTTKWHVKVLMEV